MSRRNNTASRCERCRMHVSLCVCPMIPTLTTRTRLVLVIHRAEVRKPTNTGRLATLAMPNSELVIRGREDDPEGPITLGPDVRPLFLFPHEDAVPLATLAEVPGDDRPVTLVVPDGNWRQASKVRNRVAGMRDVPCVSLDNRRDPSGERKLDPAVGPDSEIAVTERIWCTPGEFLGTIKLLNTLSLSIFANTV